VTSPKLTFIPDILEEHYEELQYLWGHRQVALRSPRHVLRHLTEFEERMEAHVQGLLIAVEAMVPLVEGDSSPTIHSKRLLPAICSSVPGTRSHPEP
jgi:hypothetical protein